MSTSSIITALPGHKSTGGPNEYTNVQHVKKTWTSVSGGNPVVETIVVFDEGYPSAQITYTVASSSVTFTAASLKAKIAFELMSKLYEEINKLRQV